MPQNVYAQSFAQGQSIGGEGGLMGILAQRRRDAIANQLLRENGYPGTGGEVEMALTNRMAQLQAQTAQRQAMADLRSAESTRIQRQADGTAAADRVANHYMATHPGFEGNQQGGVAELNLYRTGNNDSAKQKAAQDKLNQAAEQAKQRALAARVQISPQERAAADENKTQIKSLTGQIDALRAKLIPSGLPIDDMVKADSVQGINSVGKPGLIPPGTVTDADADQYLVSSGGKQIRIKAPDFSANATDAKAIQSSAGFLGTLRNLKDMLGQRAKVKAAQAAPFASKIAEMAATGDPDAAEARSAIANGKDPEAVYERLVQHKQAAGFNPAPAAPAPADGSGGPAAPGADPGATSSFGVPFGYNPASAADGMDPLADTPTPATDPDDETDLA